MNVEESKCCCQTCLVQCNFICFEPLSCMEKLNFILKNSDVGLVRKISNNMEPHALKKNCLKCGQEEINKCYHSVKETWLKLGTVL